MHSLYAQRLFLVPPGDIVEHPPELPTDPSAIPDGPVAGWECYAPELQHDPQKVHGPFDPVVRREYGDPCIDVPGGRYPFFFTADSGSSFAPAPRFCWSQSGFTLRFVRKRAA